MMRLVEGQSLIKDDTKVTGTGGEEEQLSGQERGGSYGMV